MCKCTPNIRTPFCGKPNCAWPDKVEGSDSVAYETGMVPPNVPIIAIQDFKTEELEAELVRRKTPNFPTTGLWEILVDDDDGNPTRSLGYLQGHIGKIALRAAASHPLSRIHFTHVKESEELLLKPPADTAHLYVPYAVCDDSTQSKLVDAASRWLGVEWIVTPGKYWRSVEIQRRKR